jgi:hypothetical protein
MVTHFTGAGNIFFGLLRKESSCRTILQKRAKELCFAKIPSGLSFERYNPFMSQLLRALLLALSRSIRSRRDHVLENCALRQQLAGLAAMHPHPRLAAHDRVF